MRHVQSDEWMRGYAAALADVTLAGGNVFEAMDTVGFNIGMLDRAGAAPDDIAKIRFGVRSVPAWREHD